MQEKRENQDKVLDLKGTFEVLVEEELPELSQIEAIKSYKEDDSIEYAKKRKKNSNTDDEGENEDSEHLRRVKKELLDSLERVDKMAHKIFDEKEQNKENIRKVKSPSQKEIIHEPIKQQIKEKTDEERFRE